MLRKLIIIIGLALIPFSMAVAQTPNPSVVYEGVTIEIEPEKGPVQGCVSKVVTTETLNDTTVETEGFIVSFNTDEWIITGIFTGKPKAGEPGSHLEDCFHMVWD